MNKRNLFIFGSAFLDGFTMAGFLGPLRRPGAPTQLFADPEPEDSTASSIDSSSNSDTDVSVAELERAKKLLVRAGFQVIPGNSVRLGQR
jgi:hypothetical protein